MEADRAKQAEEEAQRQASLLQEALESLRSGDNPHLALHQLQLLHRLPLESVLSLQAQLCTCLHAVEQVTPPTPTWFVLTMQHTRVHASMVLSGNPKLVYSDHACVSLSCSVNSFNSSLSS